MSPTPAENDTPYAGLDPEVVLDALDARMRRHPAQRVTRKEFLAAVLPRHQVDIHLFNAFDTLLGDEYGHAARVGGTAAGIELHGVVGR